MRQSVPWSGEEIAILKSMSGQPLEVIASRLNGRTVPSINAQFRRLAQTPEKRAARRKQENERYNKRRLDRLYVAAALEDRPMRVIAPPEVIADRDRRADLQFRDLTAALLGDPRLGCSALDRRIRETA